MTQTVPDISPLMPMHQDPLLVLQMSAPEKNFKSDKWLIGDRAEWHTSLSNASQQTCKDLTTERGPRRELAAAIEIDKFHDRFVMVKNDRGTYRFQLRVRPSYCEYSGVIYELLVRI